MYKRIVVAVDDSSTAERVLQEAIKLASKRAPLRLINVVGVTNVNLGADFPYPPGIPEAMVKRDKQIPDKDEIVARGAGVTLYPTWSRSTCLSSASGSHRGRCRHLARRPHRDRHARPPGLEPPDLGSVAEAWRGLRRRVLSVRGA
ncbi:MAG: universal stress protein [Thiobacillus sp.]|nr:universal stress protein [Thiobacillus sp.]